MVLVIMVFISWLLSEPAWAYAALGVAVLGQLAKIAAAQKLAQAQAQAAALENGGDAAEALQSFIKSIQAKLN